jgi:hypothetical protein
MEKTSSIEKRHNKNAPYWGIALALLCAIGLSTGFLNFGHFWKGYVLDITGPAWNYILFRGLFTKYKDNAWRRFFTPVKTYFIFIMVCFFIENAQYLNLYNSTYDSFDFVAYVSLLTPLFLLDLWQSSHPDKQYF